MKPTSYEDQTVDQPTAYACIDSQTLADLVGSMDGDQFNKRYLLVDCRYPYEYEAGHILVIYFFVSFTNYKFQNAVNLYETSAIRSFFFPEDENTFAERSARVPIFYCEYSKVRGPLMYAHFNIF